MFDALTDDEATLLFQKLSNAHDLAVLNAWRRGRGDGFRGELEGLLRELV